MILLLARYYSRKIAGFLLAVFYLSVLLPAFGNTTPYSVRYIPKRIGDVKIAGNHNEAFLLSKPVLNTRQQTKLYANKPVAIKASLFKGRMHPDIGGPSQPEMSSFKSVGTDNMVNLFTGDFSYNIPLLDVGGYPVNIFYNGGISPEQEASWVGAGWNINPGNINRNMRGIPDDFNGQDTLYQMQRMKPNKTWGLGLGADVELFGIKAPVNVELGATFNNYLGPSLNLGVRGTASFKIKDFAGSEKTAGIGFGAGGGLSFGLDLNSRLGATFSGNISLNANANKQDNTFSTGLGLATGYNSRNGIKDLQISGQTSFSSNKIHYDADKNLNWYQYKAGGSISPTLYSSSITFAKPSYTPSLRLPLTNKAWSGHFQLGLGSFGVAADVEAEVHGQKSSIEDADTLQMKQMVGYLYYQNAVSNPNAVMDFTRFNDREITPNTPVISVPQYSYDVFSIQGEGTGGTIRAYRNDLGYVRDNTTTTKDQNFSIGADVDPPGHFGANFNKIKTPSTIGEWNAGNKLRNKIQFKQASETFENVYFRNPGENCVMDENKINKIGGTDLVRFVLGGNPNSPTIEPRLEAFTSTGKYSSNNVVAVDQTSLTSERNKRTQITSFLTAEEASVIGLDKMIKSYDNQSFLDNVTDTLLYTSYPRVDGKIRKAHHISQINVMETNGRRYVYGIPVYNITQKDFTFSVKKQYNDIPEKVEVNQNLMSSGSDLLKSNSEIDGYIQTTTTPGYAHSFLLSGILSPDYVDVTNNGITEDDLGDAVKFNYTWIRQGNAVAKKWRTPLTNSDSANFNPGNRTENKDDKAIISYGERESWYVQSIESKTMIALFYISNRDDAKGPASMYGGIDGADQFAKKLDSIALYNKADLKLHGLAAAKPVKTVHFAYSYTLCVGTPDNPSHQGKLTLDNIYFTYNGKTRTKKNKYIFSYASGAALSAEDNPVYSSGSSDRWGNYKSPDLNPAGLPNRDYPYSIQDETKKTTINQNASAWMLKKIVVPSGAQIEVDYESDDYAYVQNRRAAEMMNIVGYGSSNDFTNSTNRLYNFTGPDIENDYVFIRVPLACNSSAEVKEKYLQGVNQLSFKIMVQMPKGYEYIPCYATYNDYGYVSADHNIIWVRLNRVNGKSPLSITTLEYLRQQLPGQAYTGYDVSNEEALQQIGEMLEGMIKSLRDAFTDPVNALRKDRKAMRTDLTRCFVRLNDPDGFKYGGGYRVKSVKLKDNWNAMTGQFTSVYGQQYDYTTTENFNGVNRKISSGVASYEPSIGGEENPFQEVIQIQDNLPLGPASYGAIEMPVLDAFFPAPLVGYSKVTVSSIKTDQTNRKSRSGIGKQVTEYYTAKDFPVYTSYTPLDGSSVKEFHQSSILKFFNKYAYDYKALSQGFLVATNDMHGKMKSQSSYADNDSMTRISYTENFYRNTGVNGMNEVFSFVNRENSGAINYGNMGIDVELMTDTREFSVKSTSLEMQGQYDMIWPYPVVTIWPVTGTAESIYRAVTTTKVISYHSVLDSVVVIDKGSQVTTKNLLYDAYTGEVLVTSTNNEFNQPVYNTSYPAYWAYSGMGLAYKNIDAVYTGINFKDGRIVNAGFNQSVFESGDELLIKTAQPYSSGCDAELSSGDNALIWVVDKNKNNTALTTTTPDLMFIDAAGNPYTMQNVSFRIVRSGHRNMLDAKVAGVTNMIYPVVNGKLKHNSTGNTINASAAEFKEKWQTDNDVIRKVKYVTNPLTCKLEMVEDPNGNYETINPYCKGLLGNFKPYRSLVFYDGRMENDTSGNTNISANGFLKDFKPYWDFNISSNLVPDSLSSQWLWNSRITKSNAKGLELETQDALNIYTAAQYGYNKTLPVAIASNARYNEMFAEGFEDYGYAETLNNTHFNTGKRHIDFSKMSNAVIINTDTASFKAHSGKYVLQVNNTGTLNIPLSSNTDFTALSFTTATKPVINKGTYGGNFTQVSSSSNVQFNMTTDPLTELSDPFYTFNKGGNSLTYVVHPYVPNGSWSGSNCPNYTTYNYNITNEQYLEIPVTGVYTFKFSTQNYDRSPSSGGFPMINNVTFTDSANNIVTYGYSGSPTFDTHAVSWTNSFCMQKGVYKLSMSFYFNNSSSAGYCATFDGNNNLYLMKDFYTVNVLSAPSSSTPVTFFRNYTIGQGCSYTKATSGTDDMKNPVFGITPGKTMLLTAWVKESCGNPSAGIPCREYTYTHNQIQLSAGGVTWNQSFNPSGPIIDGWQRYEAAFTLPANATSVTMSLVNSGSAPVYFDDIRIHPFNANVKSYVYDPVNLRLVAELDANNYASFYEYDEEGTLIRTKAETKDGIKTIKETRSSLQKVIQGVQ